VELSKTKLKEAAEKSSFQKGSMDELQLRLQDDRKVPHNMYFNDGYHSENCPIGLFRPISQDGGTGKCING
jgi:hypothetical protein